MAESTSKWSSSTQLIIGIITICAVLIGWGYTFSSLQQDTERNSEGVAKLTIRMEQNDSKTDLNDARISALEKVATDAILLRRQLEGTLSEFKSNIAVIKEILERMDAEKKEKKRP